MHDGPHWKVSLHGGHSGKYCDHATGSLREILEAAVAKGYHTFGVSEHAPRTEERLLYAEERERGWDVARLKENFKAYADDLPPLVEEFSDRLTVLRGFEIEVVPDSAYVEIMSEYRSSFAFEYIVGSVHHVNEILIDGPRDEFKRALEECGGLEELGVAYYRAVGRMVAALKPEVVGHLDLIRKNAPSSESVETERIREEALGTLETIRDSGGILDVNTAGYRKGLGMPYPAPWLLKAAKGMGIGFCFGDDSHGPGDVGAGIEEARDYLLENGVTTLTTLARDEDRIVRQSIPLT